MADLGALLGAAGLGGTIGQAIVRLELDTTKYNAEMKAAQSQTTASANAMGASTSKYAGLAKAAFLGAGIAAVAGVAVSIKAASDLNEQINKTKVVFKDSAEEVLAFSKTTASSLGTSETAALTAAGSFGQILDAAGLAESATADMSIAFVKLAADLASFNNIDPTVALQKLQAGLAGQARPLREVGVFLSAARVEAEAYGSGIAEVGVELTDAQKIQARYNIILQDTAKAQGDFQRTVGESLPNQIRVFKAELEDTAAQLGTALLPLARDFMKVAQNLIPILRFLAEHLDLVVIALAGFAVYKWLPGMIDGIAAAAVRLSAALGASLTAQGSLSAGFAVAAGAAGSLVTAMAAVPFVAYEIAKSIDDVEPGMEALNERMKTFGVVRGPAMQEAADRMGRSLEEMNQKAALASEGVLTFGGDTAATRVKVQNLQQATVNFAHKTDAELKEWSSNTKESFDTYVHGVALVGEETVVTRSMMVIAFDRMERRARDMAAAMREIREEDWINPKFVTFLSEQGPEWLIGFSKMTVEEQHKAQEAWKTTTEKTDSAKQSLDRITGVLDDLDKGESKHTVIIEYRYEGFDPSKPGMAGSAQQR